MDVENSALTSWSKGASLLGELAQGFSTPGASAPKLPKSQKFVLGSAVMTTSPSTLNLMRGLKTKLTNRGQCDGDGMTLRRDFFFHRTGLSSLNALAI